MDETYKEKCFRLGVKEGGTHVFSECPVCGATQLIVTKPKGPDKFVFDSVVHTITQFRCQLCVEVMKRSPELYDWTRNCINKAII